MKRNQKFAELADEKTEMLRSTIVRIIKAIIKGNYYFNIACIYFLVGTFFLYPAYSASLNTPPTLPVVNARSPEVISGNPVKIQIPSIAIDLAVTAGEYSESQWTDSPSSAVYARVSSLPNSELGNTIIYGHNTPSVFYPTQSLRIGARALITTDNNHVFEYEYTSSENVQPDDVRIFRKNTSSAQLVILTCDGFWDQQRRLMYFTLVSVT